MYSNKPARCIALGYSMDSEKLPIATSSVVKTGSLSKYPSVPSFKKHQTPGLGLSAQTANVNQKKKIVEFNSLSEPYNFVKMECIFHCIDKYTLCVCA